MKENFELENNVGPWQHILVYALTFVTGVLGLLDWLMLREMVLALLSATSIDRWSWGAIDKFGFIIFGIAWLIVVLLSAHYYEKGIARKKLWRYFFFTTGVELIILFLTHILPVMIKRGQYSAMLMALEAVVGIACIVASFYIKAPRS